jgi:hypothetical protein
MRSGDRYSSPARISSATSGRSGSRTSSRRDSCPAAPQGAAVDLLRGRFLVRFWLNPVVRTAVVSLIPQTATLDLLMVSRALADHGPATARAMLLETWGSGLVRSFVAAFGTDAESGATHTTAAATALAATSSAATATTAAGSVLHTLFFSLTSSLSRHDHLLERRFSSSGSRRHGNHGRDRSRGSRVRDTPLRRRRGYR